MLLPTIFVYRDPPKPESSKKLKEVLGGALIVLSDARFMLLIFVYSCFWILYFQKFGTVLWYLRDFIDSAPDQQLLRCRSASDFYLRRRARHSGQRRDHRAAPDRGTAPR